MKKYEIIFTMPQGEFKVATDDIADLLSQSVLQKLLGVNVSTTVLQTNTSDVVEQEKITNQVIASMDVKINSLINAVQKHQSYIKQLMDKQARQEEDAVKPVLEKQEETVKTPVSASSAPSSQHMNFLNITPDKMQPHMWEALSADQQREWMRKNNMR